MQKWSLIPRETIHPDPSHQPQENFEETKAQPLENLELRKLKPIKHTAPHIVQQNKQQQKDILER